VDHVGAGAGQPDLQCRRAVQFDGQLNTQALQHSLDEVVRRHESCAAVTPRASWSNRAADAADPPGSRRLHQDSAMAQFQHCADALSLPFLLAEQPPLRRCWSYWASVAYLAVDFASILSDRWSVGVLMQEVAALYGAYSQGKPSVLPELPIQYGDIASGNAGSRKKGQASAYWRQN